MCLSPPSSLLPSLTGFRNDFRRLLSPFHTSSHCPILFIPQELLFHLFLILPFIFPSMLSLLSLFSPPQIPSVLCSTPPLTSLSFSAPVEYYRILSPLVSFPLWNLFMVSLFHPCCLLLSSFPSLHAHAASSDSHFTVIYGNPSSKSSSQRQSLSLHPPRSSSTPRLISPPLD